MRAGLFASRKWLFIYGRFRKIEFWWARERLGGGSCRAHPLFSSNGGCADQNGRTVSAGAAPFVLSANLLLSPLSKRTLPIVPLCKIVQRVWAGEGRSGRRGFGLAGKKFTLELYKVHKFIQKNLP